MTSPRPLLAGNWKMNGLRAQLSEIAAIRDAVAAGGAGRAETALCVPTTLLATAADLCKGSHLAIGAQDSHMQPHGAHTGDISAHMLADAGAAYVIVGHSERRADHAEGDGMVLSKAEAVLAAGLTAIICVGETRAAREAGEATKIVGAQLAGSLDAGFDPKKIVIAYEPVWAIGTGLTPTAADVADMHAFIRARLQTIYGGGGASVRILYGGSVKPSNAAELMGVKNVDGALVGGASLKCADFMGIAAAFA